MRILKTFKFNVFGSADSKGVTQPFSVSADSTGFTVGATFGGRTSEKPGRAASVRINDCDNTKQGNMLVIVCQGPIGDELPSGAEARREHAV